MFSSNAVFCRVVAAAVEKDAPDGRFDGDTSAARHQVTGILTDKVHLFGHVVFRIVPFANPHVILFGPGVVAIGRILCKLLGCHEECFIGIQIGGRKSQTDEYMKINFEDALRIVLVVRSNARRAIPETYGVYGVLAVGAVLLLQEVFLCLQGICLI